MKRLLALVLLLLIGGSAYPAILNTQTAHVNSRTQLAALTTSNFTAGDPVWLEEAGREGFFKWNSSNLSAAVAADPGQGIYMPPASAPTGASGAWVRQFDGAVSSDWFGAVCNGVTNDTTAFANLATFANFAEPEIYIPAGDCLLRSQIAFTGTVTIAGAGREKTVLVWDASATGVGLKIAYADADDRSHVRDLSFLRTGVQNNGTALLIDGSGQVVGDMIDPRAYLRAVIHDIEITSTAVDGGASFNAGLHIDDILGAEIVGFSFRGSHTAAMPTANLGTAIKFTHDSSGEPVSPHLRGITVYRAAIALDILHYEGVLLSQFEFVAVNLGIKWRTDGTGKPQLVASDGHISAYDGGIDAQDMTQSSIHDILFYRRLDSTTAPYYHILSDKGQYNHYHNNTFVDPAPVKAAVDIRLTNGLRETIGVNLHQTGVTALDIASTSDDTAIADQNGARGSYTNWLINNGTRTKKAGSRVTVQLTSDAVIATGIAELLAWDTAVVEDSPGYFDAGNPTCMNVERTGIHDVQATIAWEALGTGNRRLAVFREGVVAAPGARSRVAAIAAGIEQNVTLLRAAFTQGDCIAIQVIQDSGADRSVLAGATATLSWVSD